MSIRPLCGGRYGLYTRTASYASKVLKLLRLPANSFLWLTYSKTIRGMLSGALVMRQSPYHN